MADPDWDADKARYPRYPFLKEHSIWALYIYRFGRRLGNKPSFLRPILRIYYRIFQILVETILGIGLPKEVVAGPGLKIWHFGGIFIHPHVVLGAMCTLRQGVTIGNIKEGGPVPVIGDNVEIGAYAQIIGGVKIGDDAKIGAGAVVLDHVPARATVVGNPARIVHLRRPEPKPADEAPAVVRSQDTGVATLNEAVADASDRAGRR